MKTIQKTLKVTTFLYKELFDFNQINALDECNIILLAYRVSWIFNNSRKLQNKLYTKLKGFTLIRRLYLTISDKITVYYDKIYM